VLFAGLDDLLGGMSLGSSAAAAAPAAAIPAAAAVAADPFDLLGGSLSAAPAAAPAAAAASDLPVLVTAEKGKGLVVRGKLRRQGGKTVYNLHLTNGSAGPLDGFMVQVNSNSAGLAPVDQVVAVGTLAPGGSGSAQVVMAHNAAKQAAGPFSPKLQVRLCAGGGERKHCRSRGSHASLPQCSLAVLCFCKTCTHLNDSWCCCRRALCGVAAGCAQDQPAGRAVLGRQHIAGGAAGGGRHHRRPDLPQHLAHAA
jgi:hypothetical protein